MAKYLTKTDAKKTKKSTGVTKGRRNGDDTTGKAVGVTTLKRQAEVVAIENPNIKPHEWLNAIMLGQGVEQVFKTPTGELKTETVFPGMDMRVEAANAAAQYYAPKLTSQKVDAKIRKYEDLSDEELEAALRNANGEDES